MVFSFQEKVVQERIFVGLSAFSLIGLTDDLYYVCDIDKDALVFLSILTHSWSPPRAMSSQYEAYVRTSVQRYLDPDKTTRDVCGIFGSFSDLRPKLEPYIFNDGSRKELLCLEGNFFGERRSLMKLGAEKDGIAR